MSRPTKREEIEAFLIERGLPLTLLDDDLEMEKEPETYAEMRDALMRRVWRESSSLKGVALVQALKTLAALAQADPGDPDAIGAEPLIADVIAGIAGLSIERRDEILRRELARLDLERERILGVIEHASS